MRPENIQCIISLGKSGKWIVMEVTYDSSIHIRMS